MSQHTSDALTAELKGSTSSMPKPASGHEPEPVPSTCYFHNLCLQNTTDALVGELKVSTSSVPRPAKDTILSQSNPPVTSTTYVSKIQLMLW